MKHLSQKELVHEGFGSFMGKLGAGLGAAGRELGKELLKDTPALTGAAKSMGSIIKAATDTDPLIAIKNYLKDDRWAKKHINDDMRERGSLGKPGPVKDSGGKVKNKNIIHVPIIRGKYVNPEGIEEDFAGGHISMMRDADGKWKVDQFFGPKDPKNGVMPASTPMVTSGRPAPGAEIKDSKEEVLKVGDRVEFTKGAREMQGKKGAIKSIEGPAGITISVEPGGSEAKGVDPQLVVKIAPGAEEEPGAEPPGEPSMTDSEAEPEPEALTFKSGDAVSYTNKKGKVNDGEFVKDLGGGKSEVKFTGGRAMAVSNNQLQAAEAPPEPEAEPPAEASTTDEVEPPAEPDADEVEPPAEPDADAPAEKSAGARGRKGPRGSKSETESAAARRIARALKSGRPPSREDIDMLKRAGVKGHQKIGGVTLRNLGRRTKLADSFSQKELLQHLILLAR